jgi:hypothetical protein
MTNTLGRKTTVICAAVLGIIALTQSAPAHAASDFSFALSLGNNGRCYQPAPVAATERRWVPERYEMRNTQVLVVPEHYERQWVAEQQVTRYDRYNRAHIAVIPGYWTEALMPARYETRCTRVLIPGYWEQVPVTSVSYYGQRFEHHDRHDRWDSRNDYRHDNRGVSLFAGYRR